MKETLEGLRQKIDRAEELGTVVRTMKALSSANINQYEKAVDSLEFYHRTVQLGLLACFSRMSDTRLAAKTGVKKHIAVGAIVLGSDQGLVGSFNERLTDFVVDSLGHFPGKHRIWAVGAAMCASLQDAGLSLAGRFESPHSVHAIAPLVGKLLSEVETALEEKSVSTVYLFHNRLQNSAAYEPVRYRFIPLNEMGRAELSELQWPTQKRPEVIYDTEGTLTGLLREYFFVSIFRACAQSLSSEHTSRLLAMQRAEKNINELLKDMNQTYHQLRQRTIDEELFDIISGAEALQEKR